MGLAGNKSEGGHRDEKQSVDRIEQLVVQCCDRWCACKVEVAQGTTITRAQDSVDTLRQEGGHILEKWCIERMKKRVQCIERIGNVQMCTKYERVHKRVQFRDGWKEERAASGACSHVGKC